MLVGLEWFILPLYGFVLFGVVLLLLLLCFVFTLDFTFVLLSVGLWLTDCVGCCFVCDLIVLR